jgi:transcriptional antiterminator RfaH
MLSQAALTYPDRAPIFIRSGRERMTSSAYFMSMSERTSGIPAETIQHWYLVHTKPLGERTARANLERQGYAIYLPQLVQATRRQQRWSNRVVPLFPRYLFLQLDSGRQSLRPVHSTVGVSNIVRFGMRCAVVRDEVLEELRARADPATGLHRLQAAARFARGTRVRITAGPFCGINGIFEQADGTERVTILLNLLGQEMPVGFPTEFVASASC